MLLKAVLQKRYFYYYTLVTLLLFHILVLHLTRIIFNILRLLKLSGKLKKDTRIHNFVFYYSQKFGDKIYEELRNNNELDKDWIETGRLCAPRLIFYFERCPPIVNRLKKLEHNLEDKIYHILKKTRIISSTGYIQVKNM